MNWSQRYIKESAVKDTYQELFDKFAAECAFKPASDVRHQAYKAYTSVPLKSGEVIRPAAFIGIDPDLLDHAALTKVCDEWSDKLAKETRGDARSGNSYYWPVANHLAEMKDYHQSQYQPQLGEGIFEPPSHREQVTRRRRR